MSNIYDEILNSNTILLLAHESPDGDAIGSLMGMYHMLINMNKKVDVVVPEMPETFLFLNSIETVNTKSDNEYDLTIVLDCASKERIGQTNNEFDRCKKSIVIDHHLSNKEFGDINYVEADTSSCCQVLYYLFKEWNINITNEMGEALAVGMLTDTSGFRNNNTNKKTFLMAAELADIVDLHSIYYLVLSKKSMAQYLLMKMTLDRLELLDNGKIAFSYISEEDMANVGAKMGDHEGLVDLGRNIGGVEVSIFMRECADCYRISLRSNGLVNVNEIAKKFGGGGHKMAAGIKLTANFKETKESIIDAIKEELSK